LSLPSLVKGKQIRWQNPPPDQPGVTGPIGQVDFWPLYFFFFMVAHTSKNIPSIVKPREIEYVQGTCFSVVIRLNVLAPPS